MMASLRTQCPEAHVVVFPFDDACERTLIALNLPNTTIVGLTAFEDAALLAVKPTRTQTEYCWTCTPATILYVLENLNADQCTYLDADLYFWDSPELILSHLNTASILITPHRYPPNHDQSAISGIYCVQWVSAKNNQDGLKAIRWWRDACLDWCYATPQDGKLGDQKYLDDWTVRFEGVHVVEEPGAGLAPWNMSQYEVEVQNGKPLGKIRQTKTPFPVIFFHFHSLKFLTGEIHLTGYPLANDIRDHIYRPYVQHLLSIPQSLPPHTPPCHRATTPSPWSLRSVFDTLKTHVYGNSNRYSLSYFKDR